MNNSKGYIPERAGLDIRVLGALPLQKESASLESSVSLGVVRRSETFSANDLV
jgi:hypothetical protein